MAPRFSGKFLYSSISCVRKHDEILLFCYNSSYRKTVYERKLLEMIKKLAVLFKNDIVLLISFCLALLSCLITPPGPEYLGYLDFHTLILLFCLMLIVEGLREANFFPVHRKSSALTNFLQTGAFPCSRVFMLCEQYVHH